MGEIEKWTSKMKPQGTERYFRIDRYCDERVGMRDQHWQRIKGGEEPWGVSFMRGGESILMPQDTRFESVQTDVAVYDDKMYTVSYSDSDSYLCVSAIGQTNNEGRVFAKARMSFDKLTPLVANEQGVFVVDAGSKNSDNREALISWFDHEGGLVKKIMISGDIEETYICGSLLFYLKADNDDLKWCKGCSAYWMDLETEKEHRIFQARYENQVEESVTRWVYVKHIFGNERGAVMLVSLGYEHDVEDGCFLHQCCWTYYDFKKIGCLSNSQNGPQTIYNYPEKYQRWIRHCLDKYGYDPYYINIMAFDMEKNLMWVSQKQNGDGSWEPMNITLDLQKSKRPDLPVWNLSERIEELKCSDKIYFDGERCYTYLGIDGRNSFCSIDAEGSIERWRVEGSQSDFRILGNYVRIVGADRDSFLYFPTSHEFQKLLCTDDLDDPYCSYNMHWMIREYEEKQRAVEDGQENQSDWKDMSGSDEEDTIVSGRTDPLPADSSAQLEYWEGFSSYADNFVLTPDMKMAKLASRTWQTLRMKPSFLEIECSFSVRKNSIRAAFIVKDHSEVFAQALSIREEIERELQGYDISWNSESNAANISLTTSIEGMSRAEQYDWFCRAVETLYEAVRLRIDV